MSAEKGFKLRSDLVIEPVEENGIPYYVIKDPRSERFYRIKPLEYYLISQFDGRTGLAEIRRRVLFIGLFREVLITVLHDAERVISQIEGSRVL